jgi:hypothetical protein
VEVMGEKAMPSVEAGVPKEVEVVVNGE